MKKFINQLKEKYNYSDELCSYLSILIPSLITYYGEEYKEIILNSLDNCEIHIQNKGENINDYLNEYFEENVNYKDDEFQNSNVPAFYINNIIMKENDIFVKPIVFVRTMFSNEYKDFDFSDEKCLHYLTHEICHLVKGYNRLELIKNDQNNLIYAHVFTGLRTDFFTIYDCENFRFTGTENEGFEEALNCNDAAQVMQIMTGEECVSLGYLGIGNLAFELVKNTDISKIIKSSQFGGDSSWIDYVGVDNSFKLVDNFQTYYEMALKSVSMMLKKQDEELKKDILNTLYLSVNNISDVIRKLNINKNKSRKRKK